jgi:hypothetical protein
MATLLDEFKSITRALNDAGIDYAVCGGWAMAIHGLPRATMDIDLLILAEDLDRVLEVARTKEFEIEGLPLHFDIEIRRISKIDRVTNQLITLDLLLATAAHHDIWIDRKKIDWREGKTSVVSREALIRMKLLAGRTQDIADVEKLREAMDES